MSELKFKIFSAPLRPRFSCKLPQKPPVYAAFFTFTGAMMERITIEIGDDGRITVMAESPGDEEGEMESMEFDNIDDAVQAVKGLMMDEEMDREQEGGGEPDMESMWNEEAAKRPVNPNMMR